MMFLAWCHFLLLSVVVNPETEKINKMFFFCSKKNYIRRINRDVFNGGNDCVNVRLYNFHS